MPRLFAFSLAALASAVSGCAQPDFEATQTEIVTVVARPTEVASGPDDPKPARAPFAGRTGTARSRLVKEGGGNAPSEQAVALGLAWLAKQQLKDGSWVFDGTSKDETAAATGLALLPFLGTGETHKKKDGKYTATVQAAVQWLVKNIEIKNANAGKFAGAKTLYGQGIATLALIEVYALTGDPALKPSAQAAINYLQMAQAANGSWGYTASEKGDVSVVGWQIQALNAARLTKDLAVDAEVIARANKFLDLAAAGSRKSMYGYSSNADAAPGTTLTAVGLLCRYNISEWGPVHPGMIDGVGGLMKRPPVGDGKLKDLYYYYYATQVVHFFEGDDWTTWNEGPKAADDSRKGGMRDWLVGQQNKNDLNAGSWDPETGWFGTNGGRVGTTAVSVLTLEVYYRYPSRYNRKAVKIIE